MADVNKLIPIIFKWEGNFANDPVDKGGATMCGVTLSTWKDCGYDKDGDGDIDVDDLKLITKSDIIDKILIPHYWNRWKADIIKNQAVANLLVDWVWASGKWGIILPQRILNVETDGIVGKNTITALNAFNQANLFDAIMLERKLFIQKLLQKSMQDYKTLYPFCTQKELLNKTQHRFRDGWFNRLNDFKFSKI
jgi:lysozyme family protein